MNSPIISIIVPIYKVEGYIHQCINSILNQTYRNLEVILVDDGSPDSCPTICDEYAKKDNRIKVIHKLNGGLSEARNFGLDIAKGEYIAFVDSDDYIHATMIETILQCMIDNDCQIGMCARCDIQGDLNTEKYIFPNSMIASKFEIMPLLLADVIGSQSWDKIYKRSVFDQVRFPIGRLYEDIGTTYLAFDKIERFCYIHRPLYYYRLNNAGISFSEKPNKILDTFTSFYERLLYAEKFFPAEQAKCLELAFNTAMGSLNYHLRFGFEDENQNLRRVRDFFSVYRHQIYRNPFISISRKFLFFIYNLCEPVYNILMRIAIRIKYFHK